jgi:hypothetical protein
MSVKDLFPLSFLIDSLMEFLYLNPLKPAAANSAALRPLDSSIFCIAERCFTSFRSCSSFVAASVTITITNKSLALAYFGTK